LAVIMGIVRLTFFVEKKRKFGFVCNLIVIKGRNRRNLLFYAFF